MGLLFFEWRTVVVFAVAVPLSLGSAALVLDFRGESFNVMVLDQERPSITCPVDISTTNDVGMCSAVVNYSQPTVQE